jgi:hypothetical protein
MQVFEAHRFAETVQKFIEARSDDPDFSVSVRSEPLGDREHKTITFWSDGAVEEFSALWRGV